MEDAALIAEDLCREPRLRIALVTETYPPEVNGVAMTLGRMVDGLLERGHRIQLIRPRQQSDGGAAGHNGLEEQLVRGVAIPRYADLKFGLPARNALIRRWSSDRPDVVHVATEGPLGWSAVSAARRLGLPVTSDFHTNFDHYSGHYGLGWLRQPVSAYLRRFHNRTAATYVPSHDMARRLVAKGYQGIEVIARGVDCRLFAPARRSADLRAAWGVADDALVVISVGRLAPEKNLAATLRIFDAIRERVPAARLVLVGDGPSRAPLQAERPDVVFAGMRHGEDLAAHYASGDLFLFPSRTETFGNVTLEAMASGLPVVAYDYAGAAELIRDGVNGIVAPFDDEAELRKRAVDAAVARDDARAIGRAARKVAEGHDWDRINDAFAAALAAVARPRPRTEAR
ncbi:MAG: glycosyltransferase family 1 protein, partial [Rhodocyclaceae bacterium]|nr:glycosyltransferase family 1 protein [Rhodocyclaceae bacterium]